MKRAELWFSSCLLLVSIGFFLMSFQLDAFSNISGVGPALFPRGIALMLICLSAIDIWGVIRNKPASVSKGNKEVVKLQIFFVITIIIAIFLINILGMLLTLALFLIVGLHYFEKLLWSKSLIISAVLTLGIYLIFVKCFDIILPSGIF